MGWRDRLRVALAAEDEAPDAAECAHAKTANSAKTPIAEGGGEVLAHLAVLAEGHLAESGAAGTIGNPANDPAPLPQSPAADADLAAMRAACEARAAALTRAYDDPEAQADRTAIAAEAQSLAPPPSSPVTDIVERLAQAMAAPRPWQRIEGDPAPALAYFRGMARNRLAPLDPQARGLLVQAAETEARRWGALAVHARGTGR